MSEMMRSFKSILILLVMIVVGSAGPLSAQKSTGIKREQRRNQQQINQAERNVKQNMAAVESNLRQLDLLEGQLSDISRDVRRLRGTSDSLYRLIRPLNDSIGQLDRNLKAMCEKYSSALRKSQANSSSMNDLTFVLSSDTFKQAWQRYRSLRQFSRWRQRKAAEITETRAKLTDRRERLDSLKQKNTVVLNRVESQKRELERKRVEIDRIVKSLRSQNKQLQKVLKKRRDEAAKLEERLEKALAEELRQQQEKERREREQRAAQNKPAGADAQQSSQNTSTAPSSQPRTDNSFNVALTGSFESNRGKLPFPVRGQCTIVKKFGRQKHPRLPKVETNNPGIDIEATKGATVHAVFDGEVSQIFKLAGYNNVIVVRHGDYVTVYANIASLDVKKGDKVKTGQQLGRLFIDRADNDRSVLHFELRHEKDKKDPEMWLKR